MLQHAGSKALLFFSIFGLKPSWANFGRIEGGLARIIANREQ